MLAARRADAYARDMCDARVPCLSLAALLTACAPSAPKQNAPPANSTATSPSAEAAASIPTTPRWPVSVERSAPDGFELRTIRHQTIHAQLSVPIGTKITLTKDAHGYPRVDVDVAGQAVFIQFDSGIGALGVTLAKDPPTVYRLPVLESSVSASGVAAWYESKLGDVRVYGYAPGVKCSFEGWRGTPKTTLEQIYTVCSSLRSPSPGPWRASTAEERAHGGMTDVPEGAWVESAMPDTPGSQLRWGRFTARMYLGRFSVSGTTCPASDEALRKAEAPEVSVRLRKKPASGGDVRIRNATEEYDEYRYPGATIVWVPRAARCCRAVFVPWLTEPSQGELDYAISLCETYRAE